MTDAAGHAGRPGRVAGLILAAGSGTRMGRPSKLLLPVAGRPLVRWTARAALDAGLDPVWVVVGHRGREVSRALGGLGVRVVANSDWRSGQGSSLAAGVRALADEDVAAVAILLGDEPEIEPSVIRRAVEAWRRSESPIVRAVYRDRPGHPVVMAKPILLELRLPTSDVGALSGTSGPADRVEPLRLERRAPRDVDDPEDYRALLEGGMPDRG